MAYVGAVRLSPGIKRYYRDHMLHVRRAKDFLLLVSTLTFFISTIRHSQVGSPKGKHSCPYRK
eukprot:4544151-Heterocapsa_arctica.AAC.1